MLKGTSACWMSLAYLMRKLDGKAWGNRLCFVLFLSAFSFLCASGLVHTASVDKLHCIAGHHSEVDGAAQAISWKTITSVGLRALFLVL